MKTPKGVLLTSGEVARHCQVSRVTVSNWIRAGQLKAFRTPGGRYRVNRSDFVAFLRRHKFPVGHEAVSAGSQRVLILDGDRESARRFERALRSAPEEYAIMVTNEACDACIKFGTFQPHLLIVDVCHPLEGMELCRHVRANEGGKTVRIMAVTSRPDENLSARAIKAGADLFLRKPLPVPDIRRHAREILADA